MPSDDSTRSSSGGRGGFSTGSRRPGTSGTGPFTAVPALVQPAMPGHQSHGGEHQSGFGELSGLFGMFESMLNSMFETLQQSINTQETDAVNRSGLEKTIKTRRSVGEEDVLQGLLTNNKPAPAPANVDEVVDLSTGQRYSSADKAKKAGVTNFVKSYLYDNQAEAA